MAVVGTVHGGYLLPQSSTTNIYTQKRTTKRPLRTPPPVFISTNATHINPLHLKDLYTLCNHSSHLPPHRTAKLDPVDIDKLRTALAHSSIVVSVFAKPGVVSYYSELKFDNLIEFGAEWLRKVVPVTPENGSLVGFGRAVSDLGLTASIYDVMVIPSLQGRGIGRRIVQRIVRMLTSRGVYDIAAIFPDKERLFFEACGFENDILGSSTMIYKPTTARDPKG